MAGVHIVVKSVAGSDIAGPKHFATAQAAGEIRRWVVDSGGCTAGARFKLLLGIRVLQNSELVQGGDADNPLLITMVMLPPAGVSEEAKPKVLSQDAEDELGISIVDPHALTGERKVLPVRYFVGRDGKAHLGILAVELAPLIGADATKVARAAALDAIFEGEEEDAAARHMRMHVSAGSSRLWQVVGGVDKGGILVRSGCDLASPQFRDRLSTGALVEEEELVGERLRFRRRSGSGPDGGWVSLKLKEKDLLVLAGENAKEALHSSGGESGERMRSSGEVFRAVVLLVDIPGAMTWAAADWKRSNPVIDFCQAISGRIDLAVLDMDTDNGANVGARLDAIQRAREAMKGWWCSG
eukprot:gnl/TRDRNA2_/TRDRNA2_83282_c0_seq1.p1 gnl/TRDRNA2_/TRDRNA2_83282_c0~~gnl/TRDRNA2_/TRDRNA2_83282_c0_seq1.p1  ORF type:complete len:355 (+),score=72.88 gnl/TRDRNA2_/TRDRNA2_83282_c0_seq1:138-1202(+)